MNRSLGMLSDNQRGYQPNKEVANFFLKNFLGCKLYEAPEITTKRFFQMTENFINNEVTEPEIKAQYEIALLATLGSQEVSIHPKKFAENSLKLEDRQKYIAFLENHQVLIKPFDKDNSLIKKHITKIKINFESGILLFSSPDAFGEHVNIDKSLNGDTQVIIMDEIREVNGK